jgi:Domain of Unknown Function (DUF1540)
MKAVTIEMPLVANCAIANCAYNVASNCHARAITIGDATHPGCDTFLAGSMHIKQAKRIAGIGACKMSGCKFNEDLECIAENIRVAMAASKASCATFATR